MTTTTEPAAEPVYGKIPVDLIDVPPDHTREHGDIDGLKASLASEGQINPITVRQAGDRFELVTGGRRLAAAQALGWSTIAAQVREADDTTRVILRATENVQRHHLHPVEEAREYARLQEAGLSNAEIARRMGRSALHVSQRLALLSLPEEYQNLIDSDQENSINIGEALALSRLAGHPELIEAAHKSICGNVPPENAVQAQLVKLERQKKVEAARESIAGQGGALFEGTLGKDGWALSDHPEPGRLYMPRDVAYGTVGFEWAVDSEGEAFPVCANPAMFLNDPDSEVQESARHLMATVQPGTAEAPAQPLSEGEAAKRAEAAERRHWRELRKADERREAHLTKRARGTVKVADVADLIYEGFINALTPATRDAVYTRCNVPRRERQDGFGEEWDLETYFAGRGSLLKLAYAAALQTAENEVDAAVRSKTRLLHGESADRVVRYFTYLEGTGYVLSPQEQEMAGLEPGEGAGTGEGEDEGENAED